MTREADVLAAVAADADALGFVFTPRSKRFLGTERASELAALVPPFIVRVALFMDQPAEEIARVLEQVPVNLLQFHGGEDAAFCRQFDRPYLKAVSMASPAAVAVAGESWPDAAGFLLDSHAPGGAGGTGRTFDWTAIPALPRPVVLAGGLTPENVGEAVAAVRPWAVDVSSGVEESPGIKSAAKMQKFVREAKREY
jgi:phosphoribosylanthranilate isomerase